jgi:hypothetical protein
MAVLDLQVELGDLVGAGYSSGYVDLVFRCGGIAVV